MKDKGINYEKYNQEIKDFKEKIAKKETDIYKEEYYLLTSREAKCIGEYIKDKVIPILGMFIALISSATSLILASGYKANNEVLNALLIGFLIIAIIICLIVVIPFLAKISNIYIASNSKILLNEKLEIINQKRKELEEGRKGQNRKNKYKRRIYRKR